MSKPLTREEWMVYLDTTWKECLNKAWDKDLDSMNDDIIRMAREAGIYHAFDSEGHWDGLTDQKLFDPHPHPNDVVYGDKRTVEILERFANLVRAAEREACAKVCDHMAARCNDIRTAALESAAENIRARGNT